jgi:hypothetical protein|tara:strand:- start:456 stop:1016 length:561 start_codon:yes stop_codon:yes gene_type:complete
MGILSRAGDLVYTLRFLRLLTTPWENTGAFEAGLIDGSGKVIKKAVTPEDKNVYNAFHKLVFNIKRLLPGKRFGSYAAALFLLKEKYGVTCFDKILKESGIDPIDMVAESSEWFVLENKQLSPGVFRVNGSKVINETCDEVVIKRDQVRIKEDTFPVGEVLGLDIYEVTHMRTGKNIYITAGELIR